MRLRYLVLTMVLVACAPVLHAVDPALRLGATPTEAAALHTADADRTAYSLPPAKFAQASTLAHTFTALHLAGEAWTILQLALILALGIAARMRDRAVRVTTKRPLQLALFSGQLLLLHTLLDLPLRLYGHHIVLRYGLSIQPWSSWALDLVKQLVVFYALGTLGIMILFLLIGRSPKRWWLWFATAASVCVVAGATLAPYLYDPLFNSFTPLAQTHPEIVAWGGRLGIPPTRMFLMNASAKVTTANAYVTGTGPSKRIVIWDTSFHPGTHEDIRPILAHEMGHYVLHHVALGVSLSLLALFAESWIVFHGGRWLIARNGERWRICSQQDPAALVVFLLVLVVLITVTEPVTNSASRWIEHNADVYGQEALHGFVADPSALTVASFQQLGEISLDEPNPSPIVEFWLYSHPSISHRAAFAKVYDPWSSGNAAKYFAK